MRPRLRLSLFSCNAGELIAGSLVPATLRPDVDAASQPRSADAKGKLMAPPGDLQPIAAQVCMKILYGARAARYDLLRAIRGLATCFTKWATTNDRQLVRLIAYLHSTLELKMVGYVGGPH